jgi:hypothetical protein
MPLKTATGSKRYDVDTVFCATHITHTTALFALKELFVSITINCYIAQRGSILVNDYRGVL